MAKSTVIAKPNSYEILMTRLINAPRDRVWQAYTDPKLVPQWWGPRNMTTIVDKMEVKAGGQWRFIQRDAEGNEFPFRGVFHAITAPHQIVQTFEFEGIPGHVLLETITLEEQDGKTLFIDQSVFQSVEDRDGMLNSGMEGGANESIDRLEELLASG